MKIGKLLGVVFVVILLVGLLGAGCAKEEAAPAAPAGKVFELVFADQHAFDGTDNQLYRAMGKQLSLETGGLLHIAIAPAQTLAKAADMYDAARSGIADIVDQNYGFVTGRFPVHEIQYLPYLWPEPDTWRVGLTMWELNKTCPEFLAEHADVKMVGTWSIGRSTYNMRKTPFHTLADIKGKIIMTSGVGTEVIKLLGAEPASIAWSEWYDALAKGVADGLDSNVLGHIENTKTHEVTNYSTLTCMKPSTWAQVMNLDKWNSLTPDLQQSLLDVFYKTSVAHLWEWERSCKAWEGWLDVYLKKKGFEGMYYPPDAEKAKWVEAVKPLGEAWVKKVSPSIMTEARAREILDLATKTSLSMNRTDAQVADAQAWLNTIGYVPKPLPVQ